MGPGKETKTKIPRQSERAAVAEGNNSLKSWCWKEREMSGLNLWVSFLPLAMQSSAEVNWVQTVMSETCIQKCLERTVVFCGSMILFLSRLSALIPHLLFDWFGGLIDINVEVKLIGSHTLSEVFLKYKISGKNWYFLVGFSPFSLTPSYCCSLAGSRQVGFQASNWDTEA